uniref:Glucosamine 6-phosphate N-acetyltransferase n=1 Tax=Setaria digitata TaxID=48799 RepID=A0A915PFW2_9BILA
MPHRCEEESGRGLGKNDEVEGVDPAIDFQFSFDGFGECNSEWCEGGKSHKQEWNRSSFLLCFTVDCSWKHIYEVRENIACALTVAVEASPSDSSERFSDYETVFAESFLNFIHSYGRLPALPEGYHLRPLMVTDYHRGYLELLSQLTTVGDVSEEMFIRRFNMMRNTSPPSYYIVVIENKEIRRVVATATLVLEWKFIHDTGCRGRIEDFVVDRSIRRQNFGLLLGQHLIVLARHVGVYKLSLECKDELIPFYEQIFGHIIRSPKSKIGDQAYFGFRLKLTALKGIDLESIEIPREHLPDPETENLPSSVSFRQESAAELEKRWTDTGTDRIFLDYPRPSHI